MNIGQTTGRYSNNPGGSKGSQKGNSRLLMSSSQVSIDQTYINWDIYKQAYNRIKNSIIYEDAGIIKNNCVPAKHDRIHIAQHNLLIGLLLESYDKIHLRIKTSERINSEQSEKLFEGIRKTGVKLGEFVKDIELLNNNTSGLLKLVQEYKNETNKKIEILENSLKIKEILEENRTEQEQNLKKKLEEVLEAISDKLEKNSLKAETFKNETLKSIEDHIARQKIKLDLLAEGIVQVQRKVSSEPSQNLDKDCCDQIINLIKDLQQGQSSKEEEIKILINQGRLEQGTESYTIKNLIKQLQQIQVTGQSDIEELKVSGKFILYKDE